MLSSFHVYVYRRVGMWYMKVCSDWIHTCAGRMRYRMRACRWNSWNAFGGNIDETLIRRTADDLIALGLADVGYTYVNIDDGWSELERNNESCLQANAQRFPSGIPALADYVHSKGLKLGIYGDAGTYTCLGFPGSRGYEGQDARTWAEWGIDYVKYDNCAVKDGDWVVDRYSAMRNALLSAGRPMVYSLCEWGAESPWLWADKLAHSWRTTIDIAPTWNSVLSNLDASIGLARFAGPGGWNDADMLEIGNGNLTPPQQRSHFVLWVLLKSPLLIGADLRRLDPDALSLLKNEELIAIHQDDLGVAGELVWKQGPREIYATILADGSRAVVFFNRHFIEYKPTYVTVTWSELGLPCDSDAFVRNVLEKQDVGVARGNLTVAVPPYDVVVVRVTPTSIVPEMMHWRPWNNQPMFDSHVQQVDGFLSTHKDFKYSQEQ